MILPRLPFSKSLSLLLLLRCSSSVLHARTAHAEPPTLGATHHPSSSSYAATATLQRVSLTLREAKLRILTREGNDTLVETFVRKIFAGPPELSAAYADGTTACVAPECQLLGPTIFIDPGSHLELTIHNELPGGVARAPNGSFVNFTILNETQLFNTASNAQVTGLHLHGMHVSSKIPQDNVFVAIKPGEAYTYFYDIPSNHAGGTYWYHMHHHMAETSQVGGGAAGAIVVNDAPNALPPSIADLPEILFGVMTLTFPQLQLHATQVVQNCMCAVGNCETCDPERRANCTLSCSAQPDDQFRTNGPGKVAVITQDASSTTCPLNSQYCTEDGWVYSAQKGVETSESALICKANPAFQTCQSGVGAEFGVFQAGPAMTSPEWDARASQDVVLLNGLLQPVLTIAAETWYRVRVIFATIANNLQAGFCNEADGVLDPTCISESDPFARHGNTTCSMLLLAKDGIYVSPTPRAVGDLWLAPGNRADVLIKCPKGTHSFNSYAEFFEVPERQQETFRQNIVVIEATTDAALADQSKSGCGIEEFVPTRPCYLASLTDAALASAGLNANTLFAADSGTEELTNFNFSLNVHPYITNPSGTDRVFRGEEHIDWSMPGGVPIQMHLSGVIVHPFHQHVNPFQLQQSPWDGKNWSAISMLTPERVASIDGRFRGMFEIGDWQDTLLLPLQDFMSVRFQTAHFVEDELVPYHCHILIAHSDGGMWVQAKITPTNEMEWPGAKLVDPTCYTAAEVDAGGSAAIPPSTSLQLVNGSGDALCAAAPSPPPPPLSAGDIAGIALGSALGGAIVLGVLVASSSVSAGGGGAAAPAAAAAGLEL